MEKLPPAKQVPGAKKVGGCRLCHSCWTRAWGLRGHEAVAQGLQILEAVHGAGDVRPLPARGSEGWGSRVGQLDKLTIISGCLFLAADIFTINSITNPDWLNTGESAGALTVDGMCISPGLPPEWVTTRFFIIMGIISLTVTCGLLVASHWGREATKCAQWIASTGIILFCMAALVFPIGFYINEVRGQPYKLPNTIAGSSYVLFVLSIFFTIVGLLFAAKFVYQADKCLNSLTLLLFFIFGG
uniref:Modulator of smoothened protein n=1 Tax=Aotus nancymaae TaxID=37293 RepID=A0A2K5C1C3_AOTNA